jgi:ubiquinone/menaquinone biosynthesis C-methylase UbiE
MTSGSYNFDGFNESQQELERLMQQASELEPMELSLLQAAGLTAGMKALDIGCGPGIVSCMMAKKTGPQGEVWGIDISSDLLAVAEKVGKASGLNNIHFKAANVYELDFPEQSFDFIYARLVFQHLPEPQAALQELYRVLKPGGIICLADIDDNWLSIEPEPDAFQSLIKRSSQVQSQQGGDRYIGHKLGALIERAGFNAVDLNTIPLTSRTFGMRNFLNLGISFRVYATNNEEEHTIAKTELNELEKCLIDTPNSWGIMSIFVATGKKPIEKE